MIEVLYSNCLLSAVTSGFTFMSFQMSFLLLVNENKPFLLLCQI